jgi:hypothetical protein
MAAQRAWYGAMRTTALRLDARIAGSNRALWFAAAAPLLVLYLVTLHVQASQISIDPVSVTSSAWQLAHHGTPRLPANGHFYDAWIIPSDHSHVISNREPGLIGLAAIFYWLLPWTSIFNVAPASLAAALVTAAAMGMLALVIRRLGSARLALVATLIAGTATTTWAVSGTALWPHGPDQLYLLAALLAVASGHHARAGFAFALAVLTRPPLALMALVAGLWASVTGRSVRPALLIGAVTACGMAGYFAYSHVFWGGGLQSQYTATSDGGGDFVGAFLDLSPHAIGVFVVNIVGTVVAPGRGVVFGSPFLLVLLPGLRGAWHAAPDWVRSATAGALVYLAVQLKSNRFGGGANFWSYRYPIEALTMMAPLLVLAWQLYASKTNRRRAAFVGLTIVSVTMQAIGATCFARNGQQSDWTLSYLVYALHSHPYLGGGIGLTGYLAAALAYRRLSRPNEQHPHRVRIDRSPAGAGLQALGD